MNTEDDASKFNIVVAKRTIARDACMQTASMTLMPRTIHFPMRSVHLLSQDFLAKRRMAAMTFHFFFFVLPLHSLCPSYTI